MKNFWKNINKTSAAKFAVLLLALVNQGLSLTGHNLLPITSDQVNDWVSMTFTIVTALIAYFDNGTLMKGSEVPTDTDGGDQGETQK
ncbi:phage holin [Lactiplantibacillus pentosus]|uniref:phage holin n=1 Tax=Lactiplantibacillus pentosus TaxID=1589 RepID=UPI002090ADED|nr:phage holin [Lactiplantibacillus pentosus]WMB62857.1 phage holin [Lactiplantibacillus pentosus]